MEGIRPNTLPDRIPAENLQPLEKVWQNATPREIDELRGCPEAPRLIYALISKGLVLDYRPKAVAILRYGMFPAKFEQYLISITRGGSRYSVKNDIFPHVPPHQGLSLETTSQVLGLTELAILKTEIQLLSRTIKDIAPPVKLLNILRSQYLMLDRSQT